MPMKNPPHPGELIRTEVIEAFGRQSLRPSYAADSRSISHPGNTSTAGWQR